MLSGQNKKPNFFQSSQFLPKIWPLEELFEKLSAYKWKKLTFFHQEQKIISQELTHLSKT